MSRFRTRNLAWKDVGLALMVLVPVIISEVLNQGRIGPIVLPFLLLGVVVGLRRRWPLWSLWWLGWALFVLSLALLFWLSHPNRLPIIFALWGFVLLGSLFFGGLVLASRGNGYQAAFVLFPWALETARFALFDDLPSAWDYRLFLTRALSVLIYAGVFVLVEHQRSIRRRWLVLLVGALAYLITIVILSFPSLGIASMYPAYTPLFVFLVFSPAVAGLAVDGYRIRHRLSKLSRFGLLAVVVLSCISLLLPWLAGDALLAQPLSPYAAQIPSSKRTIIVDTDLSHDDYVAILYLLQRPDLDIAAITIVNGVVHVEPGVNNARRLLALAARPDIPVAGGAGEPLSGDHAFPASWRTSVDVGLGLALPSTMAPAVEQTASELIRHTVASSPNPVTLIALGPLTNVAQALADDPTLVTQLETIVIGSGVVNIPGSDEGVIDWNLYIDPRADEQVFDSGAHLTIIPSDVTEPGGPSPLLLNRKFTARFASLAQGSEARLMAKIMHAMFWIQDPFEDAVPVWDAAVVAIAASPSICTDWRELSIDIVTEPPESIGRLLMDENGPLNARICLTGDQAGFEEAFLRLVR